ncbi:MAG: HAMP domain-containing protein, partial [Clostridiales bacterium]|nr:HAMP domain-containing protein [Clostridiales bacterium]
MCAAKNTLAESGGKKSSGYKKIISIFVLCILAVGSIAYLGNQAGEKIIRDGLYQSQMANIGFCETMLNDEFMILYEQQNRILKDLSAQELLLADDEITYARSASIARLSDELKILASYHSNIKECGLYIPSANMIINNLTFLSVNDREKEADIRGFMQNGNGQLSFYGGDLIFYMSQPRNGGGANQLIIYTVIDGQKLKNTLAMINPRAVNILTSMTFSDKIYSGGLTDGVAAGLETMSETHREGGVFERTFSEKRYWVAFTPLHPYGLMIYSCVEEAAMTRNLQILNLLSAALFAICICVILAFIPLTQRIVYRPVSRLIAAFEELDKGNLDVKIEFSRKDEFGYLYHVFNEMTQSMKVRFNQS